MHFDLDHRTAALSVGELSEFTLGPRDASGTPSGLWRAQLGTHWHNQLRAQTTAENPDAQFEIPITGQIFHRGWTFTLTGRIDQLIPATAGSAEFPLGGRREAPPENAKKNLGAPSGTPLTLREIKTVTRPIPADETELRAEYPAYIVQLATYAALHRLVPENTALVRAELHFVEVASGLSQTIALTPTDEALFTAQLERVTEFLTLRHRARERLRNLDYRRPFAELRAGQETTERDLSAALAAHRIILFEAPTGFGKTGILLELALGQMRAGRYERLIYLTSKATGQIQVMRTLKDMFSVFSVQFSVTQAKAVARAASPCDDAPASPPTENCKLKTENSAAPAAAWLMRPKREHCINTIYHCHPDICPHLRDLEARWPKSGLSRFYLIDNHPRDLDTLRAAGRDARICPYEITRAALPFNDIWIGDYNYIFSSANRGIFTEQPGYDPARTLLVIDEAHNLPSRVADIHSHIFTADTANAVTMWFHRVRVPNALVNAWSHWAHFLSRLKSTGAHPLATEDDARELLETLNKHILATPLDTEQMPPEIGEILWSVPAFANDLSALPDLPRLWWSPAAAQLTITCLDAAQAIGPELREFAGVVLASATLTPIENFAEACGLDEEERVAEPPPMECGGRAERGARSGDTALNDSHTAPAFESGVAAALCRRTPKPERLGTLTKRDTKKLFAKLTSAADLLALDEARDAAAPAHVRATTPWRDDAYDVAIDTRVDTTFQQRDRHAATTANTIAALAASSTGNGNIAVFFPSYAYAESIRNIIEADLPPGGIFLQPRLPDLAAQNSWVEQSLAQPGALFLVLGSSFAEGIDLLGGRISHAMVVGPALPEVNAVQRARLAAYAHLGRDAAARRVYQIPGIQKVNQALGRLVRAPGQRAKVLLHCRRFAEKNYLDLLAPEYRTTHVIASDAELGAWLAR